MTNPNYPVRETPAADFPAEMLTPGADVLVEFALGGRSLVLAELTEEETK